MLSDGWGMSKLSSPFIARSEQEMIEVGAAIAQCIEGPRVICLVGELGAGKTTIAKGMIRAFAREPELEVSSPTFQYVSVYEGKTCPIAHFDLWRLEGAAQFFELGLDEYCMGSIALVEWPDRIADYLPQNTLVVQISSFEDGAGRKIFVE